jgi:hypothetical protein
MKKQGKENKVKFTAKMKLNYVSLTPRADCRANKIKINYQIGGGKFIFNEPMLEGI